VKREVGSIMRVPLAGKILSVSIHILLLLTLHSAVSSKTALQFLKEAPKPAFKEGHTLYPLTRWGWTMPFEVRVELAENWGYALEFGEANPASVKQLEDPQSTLSKICSLASLKGYKLFVLLYRPFYERSFLDSLPEETWCRDEEGKLIGPQRLWSPEAPIEVFTKAAEIALKPLIEVSKRAKISVILNGGEYALTVYGFGGKYWQMDPRVMKAKGERSWFEYISERKADQEIAIADAIRKAFPEALYIYYHTGGTHRNRYPTWWHWDYDYKFIRRKASDLPSISIYYRHFNSGFTGDDDMLTQVLNAVAQQLQYGDALSYNWVNAGWEREKLGEEAFADLRLYMGFLKCLYTAGMVGGVAGYFAYPKGGFDGDVGEKPPHWLLQMMVLSHVHALFSHLEEFLRNGELIPGPMRHRWSKDLPAYELPTGDNNARVLARKHRKRNEWLITAWAADGRDRLVHVSVPELGEVEIRAEGVGATYRAVLKDGKAVLAPIRLASEVEFLSYLQRVSQ
jgi:hypothetical protein